ncbi:hypothetical protein SCREM1_207 [Synechococcus phage S-CREM1]|nr:hypothetical protein SCREM1_207 [Synechococcus phage S-CREM1]
MTTAEKDALDLLLEDLHTVNSKIRLEAKKLNCEKELDSLKEELIDFLKKK